MKFPALINKYITDYSIANEITSRLGGKIIKLVNSAGGVLFLKTGQGVAAESLDREVKALEWLGDKDISIPEVIAYHKLKKSGEVYLLISTVEGTPAHKSNLSKEEVLEISAKALQQLNSLNINGSERLRTLNDDLSHIENCLNLEVINVSDFAKANDGKTPEQIYKYLVENKEKFSADCIVHGDYCLPNIMISSKGFGFIDIGDCGPGDQYKDLSAMEVSIKRNYGPEWIDVFYKFYPIEGGRSEMKIKYYQLIDQFGYHLNIEKYKVAMNSLSDS